MVPEFMREWFTRRMRDFARDDRGTIAFLFAFLVVVIFGVAGAAFDFANQQATKQKIVQAAQLACQYAKKTSSTAATPAGISTIQTFLNGNLTSQNLNPSAASATFNSIANGAATVTASATINTTVLGVAGIPSLSVSVTTTCWTTQPSSAPTAGQVVLSEDFETSTGGKVGTTTFATNGRQVYTGTYNAWTAKTDSSATGVQINNSSSSSAASGSYYADLNNGGSGNSYISQQLTMYPGTYELRYWYNAGLDNSAYDTAYDPVPYCSATASNLSWVQGSSPQYSRLGVYLSSNASWTPASNGTAPTSTTFNPSDALDFCVYAHGWVQRSVTITISTQGSYWLTFAAQGPSTHGSGTYIDGIQLCFSACAGTVKPTFTSQQVLWAETFESYTTATASGTLLIMNSSSSNLNYWVAPWTLATIYNNSPIAQQGARYAQLVGGTSKIPATSQVTLVPGTYQLYYNYKGSIQFPNFVGTMYDNLCDSSTGSNNLVDIWVQLAGSTSPPGMSHADAYPDNNTSSKASRDYTTSLMYVSSKGINNNTTSSIIDKCVIASSWVTRRITLNITAFDQYQITFQGMGGYYQSNGYGPEIDNIKICYGTCP